MASTHLPSAATADETVEATADDDDDDADDDEVAGAEVASAAAVFLGVHVAPAVYSSGAKPNAAGEKL